MMVVIASTLLSSPAFAGNPTVKKSKSGICHDSSSSSYKRTKNFTPYPSLGACISSGGRLPKGHSGNITKATKEADSEGRAYSTLYDRDEWPHWIDSDGDCQNTRHEMLIATSTTAVTFTNSKECTVATGTWYDHYSGETFTSSKSLDLDHIVPLKYAHGHGGMKLSKAQRQAFANDPENLILVDLSLNRQKGAKGPMDWMPPNQPYRCKYLAKFDYVMNKYGLVYTPSEKRVVDRMKKACGL
tara:strand:- start:704 stop:1432 length:729 start_codon:yes stop_codon:yes gene_type:complete